MGTLTCVESRACGELLACAGVGYMAVYAALLYGSGSLSPFALNRGAGAAVVSDPPLEPGPQDPAYVVQTQGS